MKKLLSLIVIMIVLNNILWATNIKGQIKSEDEAIPFATVSMVGTSNGAIADEDGYYEIKNLTLGEYTLKISAIGYAPYTKDISVKGNGDITLNFNLKEMGNELNEIVVTGTMKETMVSESPVKIEVLTPTFLKNNVSTNIMEALQTVNGVQEQINCSVCGTNDIHINGMEGRLYISIN